ncbi:NAD(P)-binding protein [Periconia macrospinosa]|uniref:NAD(P)-binding protein n=1 Tax=Periconia macrospinosa TaxID=97972 RepID=A0A2V1DQF3_9PLEO|nr:NAD(P)-binding protein [Periconia macrospinosa]
MSSQPQNQTIKKALLIGAGELGSAFLPHLSQVPNLTLTLGVRTPSNYTTLTTSHPNLSLTALDLGSPSEELITKFAGYDIIISATGFGRDPSVLTKLAKEVLEAGKLRKEAGEKERLWYFPWQWGVDYDKTGDGGGLMPLFGEQKKIRDLLRAEAEGAGVKWTIVSVGIFMSFLFEPFWGVVEKGDNGVTVRAFNSWDRKITVTAVGDIGKVLGEVLKSGDEGVVYAAGDTVTYAQIAEIVERVTGSEVQKEVWTVPHLTEDLEKNPDDLIKKYRLTFAKDDGIAWDKKLTVNHKLGMQLVEVEQYAKEVLGA